MSTTNTNFSTLIAAIDSKAQSLASSTTNAKDLVFLGKAVEALNIPDSVSGVIAEGDTQVAAVTAEGNTQVAAVQAAAAAVTLYNTITVTAVTGAFIIDGTNKQALNLIPSLTYRFDQSDASNAGHPLKFSTTADGTHASGGAEFTTGVTTVGTPGQAGAYTQIIVEQDSVNLFYFCSQHSGMGNTAYSAYNVLSTAPSDGEVLTYNAAQGVYVNTAASSGTAAVAVADITLDTFSTDLSSVGRNLEVTNLSAYIQSVRIRGMDTSTLAYAGINCMVKNQANTGGTMNHNFALFSANQSTGAINLAGNITTHTNSGSSADYSTYGKASDEWTGRYTYLGHIPRNGTGHSYGYDGVIITSTSSQDSFHTNNTTLYPHGNYGSGSHYVAPTERRLGGAVVHVIDAYRSSNSKATIGEFVYNYSNTNVNAASIAAAPVSTSLTSTNYPVFYFQQYDSTNEPYYNAFHSFQEGFYGRNRSSGSWGAVLTGAPNLNTWSAWTLSNGNQIIENGSEAWLIDDSNGAATALPTNYLTPYFGIAMQGYYEFAWNIGTDEWLQAVPGGKFIKFKINPSTGQMTMSNNEVVVTAFDGLSYGNGFHERRGFWSSYNPSSIAGNGKASTFGNENSNGHGYGQSKLFFIGGDNTTKKLYAATYDLAPITSVLTYA
tara:strand:- start:1577 stop:3562 length:1986 start_codon:yes stop_codon:yes gene_type:complete